MKLKREILVVFLAVMFITLTCGDGFADMDAGTNYTLGGYIALGGGWVSDQPRHMDRTYLKKYVPFPEGFLADTDIWLKSKDGLEYYNFRMSHPGLADQDYMLQIGKLGLYHAQIEYDQLQNLYCTVNPTANRIGINVQRLRFSGYYSPTLTLTLFAEDDFLKRNGWQAGSNNTGPGNPYNFTTFLRPINYKQNDLRLGAEYDQPTDKKSIFQGRVSYHLSTFDNGQADVLGRQLPVGAIAFDSLPGSNMANYVTGEGALDLKSYKTRITGSLSYGWLSQNDYTFESTTAAATATSPASVAGRFDGLAGLSASTLAADIAGITRPVAPLTLRYSYRAYNYANDNKASDNQVLLRAFGNNQTLLAAEHYSYFRQGINLGADYRVNNIVAFTAGYNWKGDTRGNEQGNTSTHSPQAGVRVSPTSWLSLLANYTFTTRTGSNPLAFVTQTGDPTNVLVPLTYKFYSGSLNRNNANFIAEVYPWDTVTTSVNFSIYNDNFTNSTLGIQSDRGWSTGVDVSWRPHDRVALSLGYDHQQLQVKELAVQGAINGETAQIQGDSGPTLTTSDSYDTFFVSADFKLIPKKLKLTTRASYSFAKSDFHNSFMPNLNETFADIRTFLTYQYNDHWAIRGGYIFEAFFMSQAYQTLYTQGITAAGAPGSSQAFNTLDGFYRNATAHMVQAFLQYRF